MTHLKGQYDAKLHRPDGSHVLPFPKEKRTVWMGHAALSGADVSRWDRDAQMWRERMDEHLRAHLAAGDTVTEADCLGAGGHSGYLGDECWRCGTVLEDE